MYIILSYHSMVTLVAIEYDYHYLGQYFTICQATFNSRSIVSRQKDSKQPDNRCNKTV